MGDSNLDSMISHYIEKEILKPDEDFVDLKNIKQDNLKVSFEYEYLSKNNNICYGSGSANVFDILAFIHSLIQK